MNTNEENKPDWLQFVAHITICVALASVSWAIGKTCVQSIKAVDRIERLEQRLSAQSQLIANESSSIRAAVQNLNQQIEGIEKAHKQSIAAITDATPIRIGGGVAVITPYNLYYEHKTNWPAVITNVVAIGRLSGASATNTTNVQLYRFDSKEGK